MSEILIFGAAGQLGAELCDLFGERATGLERRDVDVTDAAAVGTILREHDPRIAINATAYNHVDAAEDEPQRAFAVNALAPHALALACQSSGAPLLHISTDYVFGDDQRSPRREQDATHPTSVYAASKLAGEQLVRIATPRHIIVRTCGLYGRRGRGGKGGNFVDTMIRLAREGRPLRVVDDQICSPTPARDLAEALVEQVDRWLETGDEGLFGTWHRSSSGACSWFELAREIFRITGIDADLSPTTTQAYGARAARPSYSPLLDTRSESLGLSPIRSWTEGLTRYLANGAKS